MNSFMFFLVMLVPNTDLPTIVLVQSFDNVAECQAVIAKAPADIKAKFSCMSIDVRPDVEVVGRKA